MKDILRAISPMLLVASLAVACDSSPSGSITFADGVATDASVSVGTFVITRDGDSINITSSEDPEHVLWESVAGEAFLLAARGTETVHEARGSFFVEDEIHATCDSQTVQSIGDANGAVAISGELSCAGESVDYVVQLNETAEGHLRLVVDLPDEWNRTYLVYSSRAEESFYGFGEQFTYFDVKGRKLPIFVMEQGIGRGAQPITLGADIQADSGGDWHTSYAGVPHYITTDLRSLFLENYEYSSFDLRENDRVVVEVFSSSMVARILHGDSPMELVEEYTEYCGRMRKLPDWMHRGAVIGMQGGTEKVRDVYAKLKAANAPVSGMWLQDWEGQRITSFGKQLWWNWELDNDRYPGWNELTEELNADGVEMLTYINPFLADVEDKENHRRNLFVEARDAGYLVRTQSGEPYMILNTSFSAGLVDLTNPEARTWIKEVIKDELISVGSKGWMADFGEALPYDAVLHSGESPATYHQRYPEEWQQVNREAIREAGMEDEIVFFSRSGYTKSPGITTMFWLGDQLVSWDEYDGIKTAVTGLLSSGISGYSLNHSDIGGYTTITNPIADYHRSKELLLRWIELNAFTVVFRTHEGNIPDVNHQIYSDDETIQFFAKFAQVFAAMHEYRKGLVLDAAEKGHPVVRHLYLHYPEDETVRCINHEQFLLGPDVLVVPVLDEGEDEVEAYIPAGDVWVHMWSGETYEHTGEWVDVSAPIGQPAVFYKQGSSVGTSLAGFQGSE